MDINPLKSQGTHTVLPRLQNTRSLYVRADKERGYYAHFKGEETEAHGPQLGRLARPDRAPRVGCKVLQVEHDMQLDGFCYFGAISCYLLETR